MSEPTVPPTPPDDEIIELKAEDEIPNVEIPDDEVFLLVDEAEGRIEKANTTLPNLDTIIGDEGARETLDLYLGLVDQAKTAIEKLSGKPPKDRSNFTKERKAAYDFLLNTLKVNGEFFHDPKFFAAPKFQNTIKDIYINADNPLADIQPEVEELLGEYYASKRNESQAEKQATEIESPEKTLREQYAKAKAAFAKDLNELVKQRQADIKYKPAALKALTDIAIRIRDAANITRQFMTERVSKSSLLPMDFEAIEDLLTKYRIVELERALNFPK